MLAPNKKGQYALRAVYVPAGMDPDPFNSGSYINLYKIISVTGGLTAPFDHECFPFDECDPSQYVPGYLEPPVPFISFEPVDPGGGGGDPGFQPFEAVTSVVLAIQGDALCVTAYKSAFSRAPGSPIVDVTGAGSDVTCEDTTDCPEDAP